MRFVVYEQHVVDCPSKWGWQLLEANGAAIAQSNGTFDTLQRCLRSIGLVRHASGAAVVDADTGEPYIV